MGNLLYYSINSHLAYKINETFYKDIHYVWVTPFFNASTNPYSSNPMEIFLSICKSLSMRDDHCDYIQRNKTGIIKGAEVKLKEGVIDQAQRDSIVGIVRNAQGVDFNPVIYIIPSTRARKIIEEVPYESKANPFSREYIIRNLKRRDFDTIQIKPWI